MLKTLGNFGLAFLVVSLIILVGLGFLLGPSHPFPWIMLAFLIAIPFIHNKIASRRFLTWKDEYSVGVEVLDNDHKKLINLINQLQTTVQYYTGRDYELSALDALVDYTKTHFAREEALMVEHGYPDFDEHKRQHDEMIKKVDDLVEKYHSDADAAMNDALDYLKKWLINHINGTDKEYVPFLTDKGIK